MGQEILETQQRQLEIEPVCALLKALPGFDILDAVFEPPDHVQHGVYLGDDGFGMFFRNRAEVRVKELEQDGSQFQILREKLDQGRLDFGVMTVYSGS